MFEPTSTFEAPSTNQLTALRRAPAIEIETLLGEADADLVGQRGADAGDERRELHEVAVVERQLLHLRGAASAHCTAGRRLHRADAVDTSTLVCCAAAR